jgi:gluconokinase
MRPPSPQIILIMGVAGSGKTTVGQGLAHILNWPYFEADDFHSPANQAKMAAGEPLTDDDRAPWLAAIRAQMETCATTGQNAVFTCSALKEKYRQTLRPCAATLTLVHLTGQPELLVTRLRERTGHYMKASLLPSQLATLEPPANALSLDISATPAELIAAIRRHVAL